MNANVDETIRLALTHPRSADAFDAHWESIFGDSSVVVRGIVVGRVLAGCISCFKSDGHDSIGYWIGKEFWGKGVATRALELLLVEVSIRPLHARVAVTNGASITQDISSIILSPPSPSGMAMWCG